jgi:hypothetical protein
MTLGWIAFAALIAGVSRPPDPTDPARRAIEARQPGAIISAVANVTASGETVVCAYVTLPKSGGLAGAYKWRNGKLAPLDLVRMSGPQIATLCGPNFVRPTIPVLIP